MLGTLYAHATDPRRFLLVRRDEDWLYVLSTADWRKIAMNVEPASRLGATERRFQRIPHVCAHLRTARLSCRCRLKHLPIRDLADDEDLRSRWLVRVESAPRKTRARRPPARSTKLSAAAADRPLRQLSGSYRPHRQRAAPREHPIHQAKRRHTRRVGRLVANTAWRSPSFRIEGKTRSAAGQPRGLAHTASRCSLAACATPR